MRIGITSNHNKRKYNFQAYSKSSNDNDFQIPFNSQKKGPL